MCIRDRGYSPARLLAKAVSKKLGVPFEQNALSKIYDTDVYKRQVKLGPVVALFAFLIL